MTRSIEDVAASLTCERDAPPTIQRNHIDGPLLNFSDGRLHWLTWPERIQLFFGRTDAVALQRKHLENTP